MELRHPRYCVALAEELHFSRAAELGLVALAYELLDAHADTAQLAGGLECDPSWAAHLDYLRALQRKGREMLARATAEELSSDWVTHVH